MHQVNTIVCLVIRDTGRCNFINIYAFFVEHIVEKNSKIQCARKLLNKILTEDDVFFCLSRQLTQALFAGVDRQKICLAHDDILWMMDW